MIDALGYVALGIVGVIAYGHKAPAVDTSNDTIPFEPISKLL
jgi:hypothetical protein